MPNQSAQTRIAPLPVVPHGLAYGDFGEAFTVGAHRPSSRLATIWPNASPLPAGAVLHGAGMSVFRVSRLRNETPLLLHHLPDAAWLVLLDLSSGTVGIHDLEQGWQDELTSPVDLLYMRLPRRTLGGPGLRPVPAPGPADPVALALGTALLPALAGQASAGLVDCLLTAIQLHLAKTYAPIAPAPLPNRSGLAPWQLRKAKAMIEARMETGVAVEEIARECRLSRSYFSRAFRRSTGVPPHGWLAALRLEKAKQLLSKAETRIADVALECGFADQSHLTRSFSALLGTTPAAWRRQAAGVRA
jgi:AraC-like DNA-binding protein